MFGKPNKKGAIESSDSEEEVKPKKGGKKAPVQTKGKKVESESSSDEVVIPV